MSHARPIIALLTDFGTRDPYVAVMKGVIAARTEAPIADLTHEITPFDAFEAAWFVHTVAPWWPAGTIFVCVVDPGVGTARRIIAGQSDGRLFLAPDNGLLTFVECAKLVSVENQSLFLPGSSTTFDGRDRFAPVAAALANGTALEELGPAIASAVKVDYSPPIYSPDNAIGTIVSVDRFGNCITDLEAARVAFSPMLLRIGTSMITRVERSYGEASSGPFVIVGSTGHVEISVRNANAAEVMHLRRGDRVEVLGS